MIRFNSDRVKKLEAYFGLYYSSLLLQRRVDQIKLFLKSKFDFLYVDIYFDVPKCKFSLKNNSDDVE